MATPGRACEARARSSDAAPDMPPRGRPVGTPAGRTGSAVQTVLYGLRVAEGQLLRSRILAGFAGRGATTFARGRFLYLELADAVLDRKRLVSGREVSLSVTPGGRRFITKTKPK